MAKLKGIRGEVPCMGRQPETGPQPCLPPTGLPVGQPSPLEPEQQGAVKGAAPPALAPRLDPVALLSQLRRNGFLMQVLLPSCLHPAGSLLPEVQLLLVKDQAGWSKLLSLWPGSAEAAKAMLVKLCFMRIEAAVFSTKMMGALCRAVRGDGPGLAADGRGVPTLLAGPVSPPLKPHDS